MLPAVMRTVNDGTTEQKQTYENLLPRVIADTTDDFFRSKYSTDRGISVKSSSSGSRWNQMIPYPPPRPLATAWMSGATPSPRISQACVVPTPRQTRLSTCEKNESISLTTHATHYFVIDNQCTVFLANGMDSFEITFRRRDTSGSCTNDGLCNDFQESFRIPTRNQTEDRLTYMR